MLWRNFFLVCFLLPACLEAGLIKIPVTADAGVSSVVGETDYNSGASVSVPIRQNQCWQGFETKAYLMRFDTSALRGHAVQRAWLNVFLCRGDLYGIGLCTVLAEWSEGSGVNGQTGRGGASWNWAIEPQKRGEPAVKKLWSWPGSGIYSVSWAHPDARYHHAGPPEIEKKNLEGGITALRIPVAPELVAALATGLAKGLVLTDDKGQIAEAYSLKGSGKPYRYDTSRDIYLYTREIQDPSLRPFLEVETAPGDQVPPGSAGPLEVSRTEPADPSVTVSFTAPGDDGNTGAPALGYEVRYSRSPVTEAEWDEATALPVWSVPRPQSPGTRQDIRIFTLEPGTWHLGLRAVDKAGNHGIISSCEITVPEAPQAALARPGKGKNANNAGPVAFEDILELWACPDLCKVDPVTGNIMIDGENYEPAGDYKHLNQVWSGGKRTVYLEAARGEVAAFQLILARLGDTGLSDVKVSVSDLSGWPGVFRSKSNVLAYRLWYMDVKPRKEELTGPWERIKDTGHRPAWHSAACLPLERPFDTGFSLPSMDNLGQDQRCQAVWIDFTVPRNTRAGTYQGKVVISARELKRPAIVLVMLEVLPVSMPNAVTWPVEINTYSRSDLGPEHLSGLDIETEYNRYLKIERRYYQLAHQHRTTMNVLPYNQFGQTGYGFAPEIEGSGSGVRVTSWKEWDRRFAQYLNGRAFTRAYGYQGPGAGVPVHYMYLPFCEN
ncbi:MAG: hypothetical protein U9P14_09425, partial [Gemmatimonadota bacterium]|nr:hypothetical protein [Gemmatimonadota bacterium]